MATALMMKITGKCSGLPHGHGLMSITGRQNEVMTLGCPSSSSSYQLLAPPRPPSLPSLSSSRSLSSSCRLCEALHLKSLERQCPVGTRKLRTCQGSRSSRFAAGRRRAVVVASSQTTTTTDVVKQLRGAREAIKELIKSKYCNPILVRLGWHDSGTYNKNIEEWPKCGGANGSIRFKPEIDHGANAGLINALQLIEPIKKQFPGVSYADLFQLASATAIEVAGGPKIPMRYGRVDVNSPEDCAPDGNLPAAAPPSPADHLRNVFYRMGLLDKDIVALSGAHTIGRSRPDRSGFGKEVTKYTENGPGNPGGQSWTPEWLVFDNSYFKEVKAKRSEDLLVLPTDAALFEDPGFKVYADMYAEDEDAFFKDYAESHAKLSELGSRFDPPEGIIIDGPAATTSTAEARSTSTAAVAAGTAAVSPSSGTGSSMSRKDVLLIGLGVTLAGIALKSGLEYAGMDPLRAGNVVQVTLVFGLTVVWTLSYVFRVANKEMTYVKQLKEYEDAVIQKRIEEMPEAELETMLAAIEEEKQRLQRRNLR